MVTFSKNLHINLLLFILLSIIFIVVSCGGSDNTFTSTNPVTDNPSSFINTPTPALTSKPVNAYVYISNTSLEDGENIENINTLEIPAVNPDSSDSTPLLTQISNLQKENPDDWNSTDIKELCDKLGTTLKQSIALPETAKVFTVYQDSLCSSPIPVLNGGYISGQAVVGDTDTNVQLEISLNDDNYFETETIISADNLTSSDNTGLPLKSCPEKIVILPGEVIMYQVYSTTGINLKEAGLTFSLKNSNLGSITTKPLFLEICGKKKYDKAYGFFYPKKSLTTPIDTVITAKTRSSLQLDIFTEIIKSTASISGKVFTGGKPLIKGYVKSIGPKAFCKIDSSGNYTLPRVFRGHFRKIIATYWIEENGKKIRHREEKIIDFFNNDLTNFNFGEELITPTPILTPTPTSTPLSLYDTSYDEKVTKVLRRFNQWQLDLGTELAAQKTVNWLNGGVSEFPIPEEIVEAKLDPDNHTDIWIYFIDGHKIALVNRPYFYKEIQEVSIKEKESKLKSENFIFSNVNQKAGTVGSTRILILAPLMWDERRTIRNLSNTEIGNNRVYFKIAEDLIAIKDDDNQSVYPVDRIITEESTFFTSKIVEENPIWFEITDDTINNLQGKIPNDKIEILKPLRYTRFYSRKEFTDALIGANFNEYCDLIASYAVQPNVEDPNAPLALNWIYKGQESNIATIENYLHMNDYGIIYIASHGSDIGIAGTLVYRNDTVTNEWIERHKSEEYDKFHNPGGTWCFIYFKYIGDFRSYKFLALTKNFFNQQHYNNSIVYIDACKSWGLHDAFTNNGAKVYLGYDKYPNMIWSRDIAYKFFLYMMYGELEPSVISSEPMSVLQTDNTLRLTGQNPDPTTYVDPFNPPEDQNAESMMQDAELKRDTHNGLYDETYFPAPVTVIVSKKK